MVPSSRMFNSSGTLTVSTPDGQTQELSVRCRAGQMYASRSESVNFSAKIGSSIYFSLSADDAVTFNAACKMDDTRIILTVGASAFEITNVQDHGWFFKCPAVSCKQHGKQWT